MGATIQWTPQQGLGYRASPGERNALALQRFTWPMAFSEYSADVEVGPGCTPGFPILCGEGPPRSFIGVELGNRDDVAHVNGDYGPTVVHAGTGDDDVLGGGLDATAYGGAGDDTLVLAANNAGYGYGGSGDDRITAGLGAGGAFLVGGSGSDLLVPDGSSGSTARGGSGDDALVGVNRNEDLAGGNGDDVLFASFGGQLHGGAGRDLVVARSRSVVVDAGSGADLVDVAGGEGGFADDVRCGRGRDVVWADLADVVAADCESRRAGPAPAFPALVAARAAADALLAHRPDPSAAARRGGT
jgi:Ca2+-binding RTX toxin-like protein